MTLTSRRPLLLYSSLLLLSQKCHAHVQMTSPAPINSPKNPNTSPSTADYDYTSPLSPDGSNFPCKGYQTLPFESVASYTAGSTYTASLDGSATHSGGSCQFSLSYDQGATFKVIKSIIGGCPLQLDYNFTIPSQAPSGDALFAWTWLNLEGNREFYMDCAWVTINGSSSYNGGDALGGLPNVYVANLATVNDCTTQEQVEPVFPVEDRGPDVEFGDGLSEDSAVTGGDNCTVQASSPAGYGPPGSDLSKPMIMAEGAASSSVSSPPTMISNPYVSPSPYTSNPDETTTIDITLPCTTDEPKITIYISASCITEPDVTVTVVASTVTVKPPQPSCPPGSYAEWRNNKPICIRYNISSSKMVTRASSRPSPLSSRPSPASVTAGESPSGTTPPYAVDTTLFLPCVPGSFLCTSAEQFLTCDQTYTNGAYGWTWLYPRPIAAGMMCKPNLIAGVGKGQQPGAPAGWHREDAYVREGS